MSPRPWQHVLEPLAGDPELMRRHYVDGTRFAPPWNFGPPVEGARPASWIIDYELSRWEGLAGGIMDQMAFTPEWDGRFIVPIPSPEVLP